MSDINVEPNEISYLGDTITLRQHNLLYGDPLAGKTTLAYAALSSARAAGLPASELSLDSAVPNIPDEHAEQMNYWLAHIGLPYRCEDGHLVHIVSERVPLLEPRTGLGRLIILLVDAMSAPEESTLHIDRPGERLHETYLHRLADFFIYQSEARSLSWIIETESDALKDAYEVRIERGELDPDALEFIYLSEEGFVFAQSPSDGATEDEWPGPSGQDFRFSSLFEEHDASVLSSLWNDMDMPEAMKRELPDERQRAMAQSRSEREKLAKESDMELYIEGLKIALDEVEAIHPDRWLPTTGEYCHAEAVDAKGRECDPMDEENAMKYSVCGGMLYVACHTKIREMLRENGSEISTFRIRHIAEHYLAVASGLVMNGKSRWPDRAFPRGAPQKGYYAVSCLTTHQLEQMGDWTLIQKAVDLLRDNLPRVHAELCAYGTDAIEKAFD